MCSSDLPAIRPKASSNQRILIKNRRGFATLLSVLLVGWVLFAPMALFADAQKPFSLVINNGRVINPETGLDAIRNIGIQGGRVASISEMPLAGAATIDATGLVVAPGFIDIHSHTLTPLGQRRNALDGVTTQLEMVAGALPSSAAGDLVANRPIIN